MSDGEMMSVLDRAFTKYYASGLQWSIEGTKLYVMWENWKTLCIGMMWDIAHLPENKIDALLSIWFEDAYQHWQSVSKEQ